MPDSSPMEEICIEWVNRAKQGDAYAYNQLCQVYSSQLCTFLTRMVSNEQDARDIAQEAFLVAWKDLPSLRIERYFKTWLYRIAIRKASAFLKQAKRRPWLSLEEHGKLNNVEPMIFVGLDEQIIEAEMIRLALQYVSPMYRACLILRLVEDLSFQEIADVLEINVKNVGTNVIRGLAQLRRAYHYLEEEQDVPSRGRPVQ